MHMCVLCVSAHLLMTDNYHHIIFYSLLGSCRTSKVTEITGEASAK